MLIANQQNSKISVPVSLALDVPIGKASIDMEELVIYLVMRNWSKPCGEIDRVREFLPNIDETDWVYELSGYLTDYRKICDYMYNVASATRNAYLKRTKLHIGSLICSGLVILRNNVTGKIYDNNEYVYITKEEWGTGEDFVFYFPVPVGFYNVSNSNFETIIQMCKANRDVEVCYFATLFAVLEYYFSISADKNKCWLISPVSTFFTSHASIWRRVGMVLKSVGIFHEAKQYMDENGQMKTKQIFERKEADASEDELPFNEPDQTPGVEEKPEIRNDHRTEEIAPKKPLIGLTTGAVFEPEPYVWKDFAEECGYKKRYEEIKQKDPFCDIMTPEEMNEQKNKIAKKEWEEEQRKEFAKREVALDMQMKKENAFQSFEK